MKARVRGAGEGGGGGKPGVDFTRLAIPRLSNMKPKRPAKSKTLAPTKAGAGSLLRDLRGLIVAAREQVARAVDSGPVTLYWHVGRRIRQEKRAACSGRRFGHEN